MRSTRAASSASGVTSAPASKRAASDETLTPCVNVRKGPTGIESLECAPRSFGTCMCSGIWPPMNPARIMCEPERDFWPF